jgi:hypothetical protein
LDPLDIIESTAEPAFATDETGRVVIWNTAAVRLLGYRPEDVLGKSCFEVICGRDGFGNRFCDETCNVVGMVLRKESINRFSLDIHDHLSAGPKAIAIYDHPHPEPCRCGCLWRCQVQEFDGSLPAHVDWQLCNGSRHRTRTG